MTALIEICDLEKRFGDVRVLDRVSLAVQSGETLAVIGPSGSGKSTLLRCVTGFCSFEAGQISVGTTRLVPRTTAREHLEQAAGARRVFGMIFQDFRLFPHLTALANIVEAPIHVLGLGRADASELARTLLDRVGLARVGDRYPHQLSGGQQQRVAIARALAMQPRGLLCDEITSALDPALKHEVRAVLADLRREGMTLVVVTHELEFARRVADRVAVLADGVIAEIGTPAQVLDAARSPTTRQFLERIDALDEV